jgi:hypothetical protein
LLPALTKGSLFLTGGQCPAAMASNISLAFGSQCLEIKKETENIGFQIARFANRLKSSTNRFENCPARATEPPNVLSGFFF